MKLIGLTGGIGSGKTTIAHIFETLGIPIYFTDSRAKALFELDVDLKEAIIQEFGNEILSEEKIDRKKLASIVFQDGDRLTDLNALVHPAVKRDFRAWVEGVDQDAPYAIKEAAILFETGGHREMDSNILVVAPEEKRREWVMMRDGATEEEVNARMAKQWKDEDKKELTDYIIINDGEHSLIEQVLQLHRELKS